ncbi:Cobalamin biosynthesis protein CobT [Roseobacter sp. SK209-2-6]|uniref:cobaltochelatase CobT-related protein n=1 Tax=Roseobacter sp. SK209-2-6 TaxID=388739 RepID=UPI0000F3C680|nr:cobalamin biosynthesis protein CobT [Roseobacter sp. SK209-2-6]EBA18291.1 Cobalamin biosynthesis protein CobT [Roseobacter sp. SK209-2-6]
MSWFWEKNGDDREYSIYSTAYDVEITGEELSQELSSVDRKSLEEQVKAFERATAVHRTKTSLNSLSHIDAILSHNANLGETTAVSLVVDHSGSLKGQRAIVACLVVQMVSDFLSRLDVRFEILGFTTAAWKGGKSRQLWIDRGRPRNPGRLNDVLHIRYRDASNTNPSAPWSVHNMLRSDILKENIDGEAVFWAAERLKNLEADQNLVIVITDGAPVDDSTLSENHPDFLWRHLAAVIADIKTTPGFRIAAIGIDHDVSRLYQSALRVDRLDQVSAELPNYLSGLFQ